MFDYDWFFGGSYSEQQHCARMRLVQRKFSDADCELGESHPPIQKFMSDLEVRGLVYLRDGYSYEVKELISSVRSKTHLTIECEPAEELYKVGAFVVAVPFEDIARVEVFAAHRDQKPENLPMITGFRHPQRRGPDGYEPEQQMPVPAKLSGEPEAVVRGS